MSGNDELAYTRLILVLTICDGEPGTSQDIHPHYLLLASLSNSPAAKLPPQPSPSAVSCQDGPEELSPNPPAVYRLTSSPPRLLSIPIVYIQQMMLEILLYAWYAVVKIELGVIMVGCSVME